MPEASDADVTIKCMRCNTPFVWSGGEQAWYQERQLVAPRHCGPCRRWLRGLRWARAREAGGGQ
jgi:hypothetical protein